MTCTLHNAQITMHAYKDGEDVGAMHDASIQYYVSI